MQKIYSFSKMYIDENKRISPKKVDSAGVQANTNFSQPSLNSFNKYLVNFTGLNRTLCKRAFKTAQEVRAEMAKSPKSNGIVGNLPKEWVDKIPKAQRAEKIKELYKSFKEAIIELRERENAEKAEKILSQALQKSNIMDQSQSIKLRYLGKGVYGKAYHMYGDIGDKYIVKVFHFVDTDSNQNGCFIEPNRAAYWQKNAGPNTRKVKFYFGDIESGYMINQYIPENSTINKKPKLEKFLGLENSDTAETSSGHNKICGNEIDFGGLKIVSNISQHKIGRYFYKKLYMLTEEQRLNEFEKIMNFAQSQKNTDTIKALGMAIELLPKWERASAFKKVLGIANNPIKIALASQLGSLTQTERVTPFMELLQGADEQLKINLACLLSSLPEAERVKPFMGMLNEANMELKTALAHELYHLPKAERVEPYMKMLNGADEQLKILLASKLGYLPDFEIAIPFARMLQGADEQLKITLACLLGFLPKAERVKPFMEILKDADVRLKTVLAGNLYLLPETERVNPFMEILNGADMKLKITLANVLHYLPVSERVPPFMEMLNGADMKLKSNLANKLDLLPDSEIGRLREILNKLSFAYFNFEKRNT